MSFLLKILNCAIAAVITTLTVKKLMKFVKPKRIEQVLFANNASGCCSDFSNDNSCGSRYCLNKNVRLIVNLINQCQYSVCLALYSLDLHEVTEAILNAQRRKIDVKIIASAAVMHNLSRKFTRLSLSGINIRCPKNLEGSLLHHKFAIIDGKIPEKKFTIKNVREPQGVLLTGSMNWTILSFTSNWDNIVVTSNEDLVQKYQMEFDSLWDLFKVEKPELAKKIRE